MHEQLPETDESPKLLWESPRIVVLGGSIAGDTDLLPKYNFDVSERTYTTVETPS